jgi:hypothetical protein
MDIEGINHTIIWGKSEALWGFIPFVKKKMNRRGHREIYCKK